MIDKAFWIDKLDKIVKNEIPIAISHNSHCCLVVGSIKSLQHDICEEEKRRILGSKSSRIYEFVAGRNAAHMALDENGVKYSPILSDSHGAPKWPLGITGSITHNETLAASIVTRNNLYPSIGIDLEDNKPIPRELYDIILLEKERACLSKITRLLGVDYAKVLFCFKEAIYKANWQIRYQFLEFSDVSVEICGDGKFVGSLYDSECKKGSVIYQYNLELVISNAIILAVATPRTTSLPY